jgi:predicted dehydrogenase
VFLCSKKQTFVTKEEENAMSKTRKYYPSRRTFMKGTAAALSVPTILPKSVFGANEKINLAWVGFNNQGWGDLRNCAHGNNVVALCDCNDKVMAKAGQFKEAKKYRDFRKMLDEMGDKIDAVGIGTPDHTHFAIAYRAVSMGKHVFVEKPLVHSLRECRALRELAAAKGVVTQMGNQGHGFEGARLVKEWYEAGLIGEVKEVLTWTDRPAGGWGFPRHPGEGLKDYAPAQPTPAHLDWDLWLGPTTGDIKHNNTYMGRQGSWRPWWDFGCGGLGDIGCHTIDTPYWAMELGAPLAVEVEMKHGANPIYTPNGSVVTYKFPARGNRSPVDLKWYEGPSRPEAPEGYDGKIHGGGGLIMVGSKGGIMHGGMRPNSPFLYPKAKWDEYKSNPDKRVPKTLERIRGIHADWINCIRSGKKACSDFGYSAPLTEVILLGTLAIRTGKGFAWDSGSMTIKGNPEAAALVEAKARKGWRAEDLG